MNPWLYFILVGAGIGVALWVPHWRLRRALAAPFPAEWEEILKRNVAMYGQLPEPLRQRLHRLMKQFLHEKVFEGAAGLVITTEIRVTIAAQACILHINRPGELYPKLKYILVYPTEFVAEREERDAAGVVSMRRRGLAGESWQNGRVILAWDDVTRGARNLVDGHNVVLHEFAHQLDSESGSANGAPLLAGRSCYRSWAAVLSGEFERLQKDTRIGRRSLLDHYGATNPAEFFAVATETFFEKPEQMARHHQELFDVLLRYYRIDPRNWQPFESGDAC